MANDLVLMNDDSERADARRRAWQEIQDAVAPIVQELQQRVSDRMTKRKPIEQRWLEDLRQYHGEYDDSVDNVLKADKERSAVFVNITRPKTNSWIARLCDMLFPNDERNWGIEPTPVPELTRTARDIAKQAEQMEGQTQQVVDQHNQAVEAGQPGLPQQQLTRAAGMADVAQRLRAREKQAQLDIEYARRRCEAMQREIDDQLTESRYPARSRDVIVDGCKVGIGVMKGPIVNDRSRTMWVGSGSNYTLKRDEAVRPSFRRVSYWHFFPDLSAESMEDCEDVFERHLPNKKMLRRMAREIGFDKASVQELLKDGPRSATGTSDDLNFMRQLRMIEGTNKTSDAIDDFADRYVVWEYHGALEMEQVAKMVRALGRFEDAQRIEDEGDPLQTMMVRIFFCAGRLLRIDEDYIMDSGESLYSVWSFEKAELSILGAVGVPRLMKHEQHMLNSAVRMMMDNAALATAPQVVIDKEQLEPENGEWRLTPRKIWQRIKSRVASAGAREPAFETHFIQINQQFLAAIVEMALKFVDEAVSMPLIAQGEQGAHVTRTSSGMAMLFNSANVNFRRVVKNWDDDITAPIITRTYDFNMQFSEREEIKGDMKVEARGTSVLLVREVQAEQLTTILREWSVHPILGVGFRAYNCMRMVLQAMSINPDDILVSEEEYMQKLKAMAESGGKQDPEQVRAETQLQIAQMDAASRKEVADTNERIANIRAQAEFAKLAQNRDISLQQIEAMFRSNQDNLAAKVAVERMKTDSKERSLAAEIAVERQAAEQARAMGENPTGSGGAISMGAQPIRQSA
ncbi:hypothetical protein F1640_18385 [Novosphingobium sp. NBM11]|uniref:hypothetical protein n=1 Tax=Novosphingobium sp. NBM11 TaxID=2596914 RepID=UPI0018927D62|nr:hypothetical protein [Novosphingobium sp. NBM11]MBF5091924.1 hypothetical protein [Novosphingobium sp. NBM11]